MKRSDIRNAYNMMNPTRDQKDKMLHAILNEQKPGGKQRGMYQATVPLTRKWSWVPAAAAFVLVVFAGILLLGRPDGEPPVVWASQPPAHEKYDLMELAPFRAGQEWYDYLQGNTFTEDDSDLWHPYSTFGCVNQEMADKLDAISESYGLTFRDMDEWMTDSYSYFRESMGISNPVKKSADGVAQCAAWNDGQFYIVGNMPLSGWDHAVRYQYTMTFPDVFLPEYVEAAGAGALECWKYRNAYGAELILALGPDMAFAYFDGDHHRTLVKVLYDWHPSDRRLDSADLEALADCFVYEVASGDETHTTEIEPPAATDAYGDIIRKYLTAMEEGWTMEQYYSGDISPLCLYVAAPEVLGYAFLDVDGNGVAELLVGDGETIYDMYTILEDGLPGHLLSAWERKPFYLCEGNLLKSVGSGGAANTAYVFCRLEGIDLRTVQTVMYDAMTDPENPWYAGVTEEDMEPVSEQRAGEILDSYEEIPFAVTPIKDYATE